MNNINIDLNLCSYLEDYLVPADDFFPLGNILKLFLIIEENIHTCIYTDTLHIIIVFSIARFACRSIEYLKNSITKNVIKKWSERIPDAVGTRSSGG